MQFAREGSVLMDIFTHPDIDRHPDIHTSFTLHTTPPATCIVRSHKYTHIEQHMKICRYTHRHMETYRLTHTRSFP